VLAVAEQRGVTENVVKLGLQRLGVRLEVTEAVLNHISGSRAGIAGVYQRHDWAAEKRAALDAWATHVLAVAEQRGVTENVVKLTVGNSCFLRHAALPLRSWATVFSSVPIAAAMSRKRARYLPLSWHEV